MGGHTSDGKGSTHLRLETRGEHEVHAPLGTERGRLRIVEGQQLLQRLCEQPE